MVMAQSIRVVSCLASKHQKSNTKLATDGFDALRDMDSNTDEKIDQSDVVFDQLRLWRDSNQDGISQIGELSTLKHQRHHFDWVKINRFN
jgi:hypothetical protein